MSNVLAFFAVLAGVAAVSGLILVFLRRRYREPLCQECVDMEDVIYELESAASSLDELAERLRFQHAPDEMVSDEAAEAIRRARCLLEGVQDSVEYAIAEIEATARRRSRRRGPWCVDFSSEEEFNKFSVMPRITDEELRGLDWDEFFRRL